MKLEKSRFTVLMAEDNKHDIIATRRAWKENNISNPLNIVRDGEECLDYLNQRGKFQEPGAAPRPGLVLLDLKMPKMDGLEVLKYIRENDKLRTLPVVMLTTSKSEEDKLKSYDLGVNAYVMKPLGFEGLSKAIKTIHLFWELVELPRVQDDLTQD